MLALLLSLIVTLLSAMPAPLSLNALPFTHSQTTDTHHAQQQQQQLPAEQQATCEAGDHRRLALAWQPSGALVVQILVESVAHVGRVLRTHASPARAAAPSLASQLPPA